MKKLLLISVLLFGTILAGCTNNKQELELLKQQNDLLQQQLSDQQKPIEKQPNDNFKKSQECEKYSDELFQLMNKSRWEELVVFYSSTLNTCIYGWREYEWGDSETMPWSTYFLSDVLTKQNIYFWRNDHSEREARIQELKWE